ncbi:MAG: BtpA/SgcQ family protein [Spirochaetales bacterium]
MQELIAGTKNKLLLGAIHLPSFVEKTQNQLREIENRALENTKIFEEGGFDGVFIQDQTLGKQSLDSTCNLSGITRFINANVKSIKIGSQMECDDGKSILAVAKASNAEFVRIKTYVGAMIKNNGLIYGQGSEVLKYKTENHIDALIFCDIFDRCGVPFGNISMIEACKMALKLGANGLILTGKDYDESLAMINAVKKAIPNAFILCGGSVTKENVATVLSVCDGAIVSSCLKDDADNSKWSLKKIMDFVKNAGR